MDWYFEKAVCHSVSFIGGRAPMIGFHSVMESPEPVGLVIPPNNTWMMSIATPRKIQFATILVDRCSFISFAIHTHLPEKQVQSYCRELCKNIFSRNIRINLLEFDI